MKIVLPFPPAKLSPNKRLHWAARSKIVSKYRGDCKALSVSAWHKPGSWWSKPGPALLATRPFPIKITFHPPDKRRRDRDNMIAAFKAGADGVADAIGIDDADWSPTYEAGEVIKGGRVIVTIGDRDE